MEFTLTKKQEEQINEWKEHIKAVFGEYGDFEYRFNYSSGIGLTVKIYSFKAKVEKNFTDIDNW